MAVLRRYLLYLFPGPVTAAVIHKNDLIGKVFRGTNAGYPFGQFRQGFFFIEKRDDEG
jgi:hypothetical protein